MVSEEPTVAETSECEDTGLLGDDVEPPWGWTLGNAESPELEICKSDLSYKWTKKKSNDWFQWSKILNGRKDCERTVYPMMEKAD